MTTDYQFLLIVAVFASQIFVLSFYTPMRWLQYHALLLKRYPPAEYPRLHPLPREELKRKFALFRPTHLVIGAGAILALLAALIFDPSPRRLAGLMQMCLLVQVLLPLFIALPLEIRLHKALKSMPPPSPRSVELRKGRVTDFISPLWIAFGIAAQALQLVLTLARFVYRPGTIGTFPGLIFGGAMLLIMIYAVSGYGYAIAIRPDPYMSQADTFRNRQRIYRGLFIGGGVFAAWNIFTILFNAGLFHFDVFYFFVGSSVIFQLIGLGVVSQQSSDLSTRDFTVYRADGIAQAAR
jgi:hypothetical protein